MKVIECEQGTQEWATAKRGIASASNADRIITPAKGSMSTSAPDYCCELIAEMMLPPHYWFGNDYQSSAMANGTRTEREARNFFAFDTGKEVREVGFCVMDDGRFGCSPDGLVGELEGLELKCPLHKTQIRYLIDGVLPAKYAPQVHFSMIVTGRKVWNFMSYAIGLPPLIVRVEADDYTVKVAEAMEKFWIMLTEMRAKIADGGDHVAATRTPQEAYF